MKIRMRTQLSKGFALIVLITVFLISISANILINDQFEKYVSNQQADFSRSFAESLKTQYDIKTDSWNLDYIHGAGMYAMNDGYFLKLYNKSDNLVWDAENHDMTLCHQIMNEIQSRMEENYHDFDGDFIIHKYDIIQSNKYIGYAEISYYTPYYFNENDFRFLSSLNQVLLIIGAASLLGAIIAGLIFAKNITKPISKTIHIAKNVSEGNYGVRINSKVNTSELYELTNAINQMAESLDEQEKIRKRLTSDVAHELRTPLTNISSHLEAIIEGVWEPTPERLQSCYDEAQRITMLVSDLERLRQAELENLKLNKTHVNLLELSKIVISNFEADINAKQLKCLAGGENLSILADRIRIQQVITNLLSNAIKYSYIGGEIRISVKRDNYKAIIEVKDEGIGIPENELKLIFERFYRTDKSRNRKTGGSGIGLTIVKSIIEAHNGNIAVESQEGKGSGFIIELPIA